MRFLFVLAFFWTFASGSMAQSVIVRAGEHGAFTRVVLQVPTDMDWILGRTDTGYGLRLSGPVDYETSDFFNVIPRTRIGDIQVVDDGAQVNFGLNCLCRASAYLTETRWLVIDVSEGEPDPTSLFEQALILADETENSQLAQTFDPQPLPDVVLPFVVADGSREPGFGESAFRARATQMEQLTQLEAAVGASLQRALGQGLLDPSDDAQAGQYPDELLEVDELRVDPPELRGPGVTARTSLDVGLDDGEIALTTGSQGNQCGLEGQLDVSTWGNDTPFASQIAELRSVLTGEFDRPDPKAIEDLARLYLFFGFGREAVATLRIDNVQSIERQMLINMAQVLDQDKVVDQGFVAKMSCPEPLNFWALLAHSEGPLPVPIEADSIVKTFWSLPQHLQQHLAPRVAQKLRQFGEEETALIILSVAVDQDDVAPAALVEQSQLLLATGREAEALTTLESLPQTNGRTTASTFLQLLDLRLQNGDVITDDDINTLQTFRFENTDTLLRARISLMEARARNHRSEYFVALAVLNENREIIETSDRIALSEQIHRGIIGSASNTDFLNFVIEGGFQGQIPEIENEAASRLLSLGFADLAEPLVQNQTLGETMAERRYIRADIAVQQGRFELALAHLSGIQTERADALRNQIGSENGGIDLSNEDAWRSGNWDQLTDANDALFRETAERLSTQPADPIETPTPLTASEALISDSTDLREAIETLLGRFETP